MEDFEDKDHDGNLVLTTALSHKVHHMLKVWQEHLPKYVDLLLLAFSIVARERADKFLEGSQSHDLKLWVITFQSLLDLRDAVLPMSLHKVGLGDVENDVLELVPTKFQMRITSFDLLDLFGLELSDREVKRRKDVRFNELSFVFTDFNTLPVWHILSVLTHIFLVVEVRCHGPVSINHILEKGDGMNNNVAGFLSIKTGKILNRSWIKHNLHQTSNASLLLLGLFDKGITIKNDNKTYLLDLGFSLLSLNVICGVALV